MNNILKSIAILTVALPTFTSCDNYLTELNPNETTTEVFWNTLSDTQSGICYICSIKKRLCLEYTPGSMAF